MPTDTDARRALWILLAEQFLDTETRTWLPATALACLESGFSREELGDIWRYEVSAALWPNLWSVAGEWAGWDEDWLAARIAATQVPAPRRGSPHARLAYRARVQGVHGCWVAVERLIEHFLTLAPGERAPRCAQLTTLAEHYLDYYAREVWIGPREAAALREVYLRVFLPIYAPLLVPGAGEARASCAARVAALLCSTPEA